jgi:16S rRNA (guanine(1405)-N(7))-methyltransferase
MLKANQESENALLDAVLASARYRDLCPDLVRFIGRQELHKRRNLKEAIKATKNKLHQVGGMYFDTLPDTQAWLNEVQQILSAQDTCAEESAALHAACRRMMQCHISTRERLPILDQFYATIFAQLGPIHSILDLACGLNPLSLPWMLAANAQRPLTYYACDIYQSLATLHENWFRLLDIQGHAATCNILQQAPLSSVDVALLLKTIPCLEQIDKAATHALLQTIPARYLVISFPIHSVGGRNKGMLSYYEQHFHALPGLNDSKTQRFEFATELVFVIEGD